MSTGIDETVRATFRGIADVLIPAAEGMPAASEVDVHGDVLDRILGLRPDLAERFFRGVRSAAGEPAQAAAQRFNATDPQALSAIGLVASAAYNMQPRVRELIGYPARTSARPIRTKRRNTSPTGCCNRCSTAARSFGRHRKPEAPTGRTDK